ncbi:MAG: hypothetical protein K6T92_08610, partial [Candidatus Rokubacteria bacterium]|nr:hypothetical protein [Candidatus Rokubacteria bacterium]
ISVLSQGSNWEGNPVHTANEVLAWWSLEGVNELEELDLLAYVRILSRWKWAVVSLVVASVLTSYVASSMMTPIYQASTTLLVKQQQNALQLAFTEALGTSLTIEDTWGGDLTTAAVSHLAATVRPDLLFTVSFMNDWTREHIAGHRPRSRDGWGAPPSGPGLGVEVDAAALGPPLFVVR